MSQGHKFWFVRGCQLPVICVKQKLQQHDMTDGPQRNIRGAGPAPTSAADPLGDLGLVQKFQHHF